jgi:hypothetical protein
MLTGTKGFVDPRSEPLEKALSYVWLLVSQGGEVDMLAGEASQHVSFNPLWGSCLMHCTSLDLEYIAASCGLQKICSDRQLNSYPSGPRLGLSAVQDALAEHPMALDTICVWMYEMPFIGPEQFDEEHDLPPPWEEIFTESGQSYVTVHDSEHALTSECRFSKTPDQSHRSFYALMKYGPLGLLSVLANSGTHRVHHALASAPHFPKLVDRLVGFIARGGGKSDSIADADERKALCAMSVFILWRLCVHIPLDKHATDPVSGSQVVKGTTATVIVRTLRGSQEAQRVVASMAVEARDNDALDNGQCLCQCQYDCRYECPYEC